MGVCGYTGWVGREGGWGWETEDGERGREVRWEGGREVKRGCDRDLDKTTKKMRDVNNQKEVPRNNLTSPFPTHPKSPPSSHPTKKKPTPKSTQTKNI